MVIDDSSLPFFVFVQFKVPCRRRRRCRRPSPSPSPSQPGGGFGARRSAATSFSTVFATAWMPSVMGTTEPDPDPDPLPFVFVAPSAPQPNPVKSAQATASPCLQAPDPAPPAPDLRDGWSQPSVPCELAARGPPLLQPQFENQIHLDAPPPPLAAGRASADPSSTSLRPPGFAPSPPRSVATTVLLGLDSPRSGATVGAVDGSSTAGLGAGASLPPPLGAAVADASLRAPTVAVLPAADGRSKEDLLVVEDVPEDEDEEGEGLEDVVLVEDVYDEEDEEMEEGEF